MHSGSDSYEKNNLDSSLYNSHCEFLHQCRGEECGGGKVIYNGNFLGNNRKKIANAWAPANGWGK